MKKVSTKLAFAFVACVVVIALLCAVGVFAFFAVEGFVEMLNTRTDLWSYLKFVGSFFISGLLIAAMGVVIDVSFITLVDQDKWHKTLLYKFIRACRIRTVRKVDYFLERFEEVIAKW